MIDWLDKMNILTYWNRYCVRPNAALIEPGKSIDVSIILLGLKEEPTPDFKCNDKFLIVALPSPYDLGESSVADVWPKLDAEFKPQSVSKKIKVKYVYDKPLEQQNESSGVIGNVGNDGINSGLTTNSASISEKKINDNNDEIDSDLSKQQSKIDAINEKLDSNVASASIKESNGEKISKQSIGNAPLATVILIALIAFIIGWLFF